MFLKPSEHIIIMDDDSYFPLPYSELKKLELAGIETVMIPHALYLNKPYKKFEENIEDALQTNLKILVPFGYGIETFPDREQQQEIIFRADEVIHRYKDLRDRVQFIFAVPEGGEFFWDALKTDNFPVTDDVIWKFVIDCQDILVEQHGEVWMCLNHFLGVPRNWNNTHIQGLYQVIRDSFPNEPFYSIQFAHFAVGNQITDESCQMKTSTYQTQFNMKAFVGSEFCEGLEGNYAAHRAQNLWGFITSPIHSLQRIKHYTIEEWMIERIKETNRKLNEAWQ